jgi:hypothetical protein
VQRIFVVALLYLGFVSSIGYALAETKFERDQRRVREWQYDEQRRSTETGGIPVGAIAVSKSSTSYGWATARSSLPRIEAAAELECSKHANDCEVVVSWGNGCGAIAEGEGKAMGWDSAPNRFSAESKAVRNCNENGRNCKLVESMCTW